jgi:hypothetical protein
MTKLLLMAAVGVSVAFGLKGEHSSAHSLKHRFGYLHKVITQSEQNFNVRN